MILVDGELLDTKDAPVPSPGGVAASIDYIDRSLLGPLGFRPSWRKWQPRRAA